MTFPFTELAEGSRQAGLVVAVLIGIAFGFVLERAGFGRADKLAAQFYLRDMRVFKVMFTAIVTAMLGLVIAAGAGLAELRAISESIASYTWVWPMLIGGFVLGVGFILSGYCPGTSVVSSASGNLDGAMTVAGVVTGTFLYSELLRFEAVQRFHESGAKGAWFLYDLVPVAPAAIAAGIAVMAILAFIGAENVESMMGGTRTAARVRRFSFAAVAASAAVALLTIVVPVTPLEARQQPAEITPADLARVITEEPWRVRVVDVRSAEAFAAGRVPGSVNADKASLADLADDGRLLVVVGDVPALPPGARVLTGGIGAWNAEPLVVAMTSGAPPPPPPAPRAGGPIAKPKKKGGGCSA